VPVTQAVGLRATVQAPVTVLQQAEAAAGSVQTLVGEQVVPLPL
jgi:hypothetical protein